MNSLILRASLLSGLLFLASEGRPNNHSDSLILVLTKAIETRDVSVRLRLERIEKLKSRLRSLSGSPQEKYFDVYNSLYHEYKTFIYDSAFAYAQKLIETSYRLGDRSRIGYARVKLGFILVSSGMFKETFDSLAVAPVNFMADTTKVEYYYIMARAYYDLGTYNHDRYYQSSYASLADLYMDSARNLSAPDSYDYLYLRGLQNLKNNRLEEAMSDLNEVLHRFSLPP